ncbi:MAG: hypothetical protein CM15mP115_22920 [Alphaproteobacteria bacterium]|nr:MAG: hypothetical protein CM15mP115_22920 [Alphaproteobacteria bacterium]
MPSMWGDFTDRLPGAKTSRRKTFSAPGSGPPTNGYFPNARVIGIFPGARAASAWSGGSS